MSDRAFAYDDMAMWRVRLINTSIGDEEVFRLSADKKLTAKSIRDALLEVHPEYKNIRLRRVKRNLAKRNEADQRDQKKR